MPFPKRYECIQPHAFFINSKLLLSKYFLAHLHWITNFKNIDLSTNPGCNTVCAPVTQAQSSIFWTQKYLILEISITFIGEVLILNQISVSFLTCWIFQCCGHWTIQSIWVGCMIFSFLTKVHVNPRADPCCFFFHVNYPQDCYLKTSVNR